MVGHGQSNAVGDWYGYATAHLLQDLLAIVQRFVGTCAHRYTTSRVQPFRALAMGLYRAVR